LAKPYHYVRWRWWTRLNLEKLSEEFSQKYDVEMFERPSIDLELTIRKDERAELLVKSETLVVFLSAYRAVMSQKKPAPFTAKDLELRKRVMELYPKERPTFLPLHFSSEPKFETIEIKE
jgi:hypothetical protein